MHVHVHMHMHMHMRMRMHMHMHMHMHTSHARAHTQDTCNMQHARDVCMRMYARALWSESKQGWPLYTSTPLPWQAARWAARGAAATLAVRQTRRRRAEALATWVRRTSPAAPSVVRWAVLRGAARRWRSHGAALRAATLAYLALLQRVGSTAARRVLCAWRAAAEARCVQRAHAPRAAAHRRQACLAGALGGWVARTAAAAMARSDLARGARGALLRVVASWRARAAARRASRKIMAEVRPHL